MRITGIEPIVVFGGFRNWVFVQVQTDEGLVGTGEATLEGRAETIVAAVRELERALLAKDPLRITDHWQAMYRHAFWRGGPILNSAISGVEQALWDIFGKSVGLPVWQLLGGACRDRIRIYANGPRGETPEELAESAVELKERGYSAMKLTPFGATKPLDGVVAIRRAANIMEAVRAAVGPDVDLAVDAHGRLSPAMAIEMARAIRDVGIYFFEEPCLPENPTTMATVARECGIPVATGERLFTKWGFREAMELQAAALWQPDLAHCGGIAEARQIAAMAEARYAGVAPHNPLSPVNMRASLHLDAAIPNFVIQEWVADPPPWTDDMLVHPVVIRAGWAELPAEPGLGTDLNLDVCRAHPYQPVDMPAWRHDDGSVADW
ncbi:MAG TPA: galactonate dehydratase [Thermomicrobiales bacterium]|nr:galactonate dehydratase [Thermomicrobiales bacterium]